LGNGKSGQGLIKGCRAINNNKKGKRISFSETLQEATSLKKENDNSKVPNYAGQSKY
jgi:hypothetical protein